jgi:hypothetical protein
LYNEKKNRSLTIKGSSSEISSVKNNPYIIARGPRGDAWNSEFFWRQILSWIDWGLVLLLRILRIRIPGEVRREGREEGREEGERGVREGSIFDGLIGGLVLSLRI